MSTATNDMKCEPMKSPYPFFGGKSRVAGVIWSRFGDVPNYVEPFAGSLAVPLARPHPPKTETVNDIDAFITNFWRAIRSDPSEVAAFADWPVSELDLVARHRSLLAQSEFRERMKNDPDYYDAKLAGWWVWGQCSWIGQGWCAGRERGHGHQPEQIPHLGDAGMGINRKLPHLGDAGRGVKILAYFEQLALRLRDMRIACGDWTRVLGPSVTFRHGTTAILLDPPYGEGNMDYAAGGNNTTLATDVRDWAVANGDNPELRVALCGYDGAFDMPDSWEVYEWKTRGGYGSQGDGEGRENAKRERIWFNKSCLRPDREFNLFAQAESPCPGT